MGDGQVWRLRQIGRGHFEPGAPTFVEDLGHEVGLPADVATLPQRVVLGDGRR